MKKLVSFLVATAVFLGGSIAAFAATEIDFMFPAPGTGQAER